MDNSENVQGFIINHSLGGGTGSGLGTLVLENLAVNYHKKTRVGFEIYASPNLAPPLATAPHFLTPTTASSPATGSSTTPTSRWSWTTRRSTLCSSATSRSRAPPTVISTASWPRP